VEQRNGGTSGTARQATCAHGTAEQRNGSVLAVVSRVSREPVARSVLVVTLGENAKSPHGAGFCEAEEEGFEPPDGFHRHRFSRPAQSTALPLLRRCDPTIAEPSKAVKTAEFWMVFTRLASRFRGATRRQHITSRGRDVARSGLGLITRVCRRRLFGLLPATRAYRTVCADTESIGPP
jgi:hypothetical protein